MSRLGKVQSVLDIVSRLKALQSADCMEQLKQPLDIFQVNIAQIWLFGLQSGLHFLILYFMYYPAMRGCNLNLYLWSTDHNNLPSNWRYLFFCHDLLDLLQYRRNDQEKRFLINQRRKPYSLHELTTFVLKNIITCLCNRKKGDAQNH